MIKNMNSEMTMNSQLPTTEPKTNKQTKNKLSRQQEQEHIERNRDHVEGYPWGEGWGRMRKRHREEVA